MRDKADVSLRAQVKTVQFPKANRTVTKEFFKREYLLLTQQKTSGSTLNMFYICTTILSLKNSKYLSMVIKKQLTELRQNIFIIVYSFVT